MNVWRVTRYLIQLELESLDLKSIVNAAIEQAVEVKSGNARALIADNGSSLDASLLPRIFDLFKQGLRGIDRSQGGLRIVLALVKTIVLLHEGGVHSASDGSEVGSRFAFSIS